MLLALRELRASQGPKVVHLLRHEKFGEAPAADPLAVSRIGEHAAAEVVGPVSARVRIGLEAQQRGYLMRAYARACACPLQLARSSLAAR